MSKYIHIFSINPNKRIQKQTEVNTYPPPHLVFNWQKQVKLINKLGNKTRFDFIECFTTTLLTKPDKTSI